MLLFFTVISVACTQSPAQGLLRVSTINPRYFTTAGDRTGKAVFMVGSHNWQVLQDRSDKPLFDYPAYLEFLKAHNHNFFRMWYYDTPHAALSWPYFYLSPVPFNRPGLGNTIDNSGLKFDVTSFDESFFTRLHDRCLQAQEAGIYVDVMLSGAWWPYLPDDPVGHHSAWEYGYWNPQNNVNGYSLTRDQCYTDTPAAQAWVAKMDAFIKKMVHTVNDLDNIVFEVSNEGRRHTFAWQKHVIDLVHNYERHFEPKQHLIGFTAGPGGPTDESDNIVYLSSNADWVSLFAYHTVPAVDPATKPDLLDTDHTWGVGGTVDYLWRSMMRGHNNIYMDPYGQLADPVAPNDPPSLMRAVLGYQRTLADSCDLIHMLPDAAAASTRYALVNPGFEYLVYHSNDESSPTPATITIHNMPAKKFNYEWVSPTGGVRMGGGSITTIPGDNNFPPPAPTLSTSVLHVRADLELTSAVSRKTHGGIPFDVALPGVEGRRGPNHLLVFTFSFPVVSGNASVTGGVGTVSGNPVFADKTMTVNLTGVTDVQSITVTLNNVTDRFGQRLPSTSITAGMLYGDTTGNGIVNATDVSQTKLRSGSAAHGGNFRSDVTVSGTINGTDLSQVKLNVGRGLP